MGRNEGLHRSVVRAEWLVAVGTLALAFATAALARRVARQVKVEAQQLVSSRRPLVVPLMGGNFDEERYTQNFGIRTPADPVGPHVLLQNCGVGPALNVRGSVYWQGSAGGASALHPLTLAPTMDKWAKVLGEGVTVNWGTAVGYVRYHDLGGTEWQTHFRFREDGAGNVRVEILAAGETRDYGEPKYNAQGWITRPADLWDL